MLEASRSLRVRVFHGLGGFFVCLVLLAARCPGQIPVPAINGWTEMEKSLDPIQFEYGFTNVNEHLMFRCAAQGNLKKCEYFNLRKKPGQSVEVFLSNPKGTYGLERVNAKWKLEQAHAAETPVPQLERVWSVPRIGFSLDAKTTLLDVAKKPAEYVVKKSVGTENHWELIIEYMHLHGGGKRERATLQLNPLKRYRIEKIEYTDANGLDPATYEFSYLDDSVLTEVVPSNWSNSAGKSWKVNFVSDKQLPEQEFSLESYGLPGN